MKCVLLRIHEGYSWNSLVRRMAGIYSRDSHINEFHEASDGGYEYPLMDFPSDTFLHVSQVITLVI